MLSISLFGAPQIRNGQAAIDLPRRKSRAFIFYLAARSEPVTREQMLALLWPDHERSAGLQSLRTTLHGIRKALGPSLITTDDSLSLADDVQVDARRLSQLLAIPSPDPEPLRQALDLYHGEFLEGFNLADDEAFDRWADGERERYRQMVLQGFVSLSRAYEQRGDYAAALAAAIRGLALDPFQEDIQRTAMRLHYLAGDRAGAIRRFEQLRDMLDDELGVPPMPETRALYDAIVTDTLDVPSLVAPTPPEATLRNTSWMPGSHSDANALPFIGRTHELHAMNEAVSQHRLVLLEGEPGIGKSRLAVEFIREHLALALVGVARELEHALPYQPIIEALRCLIAHPDWTALRQQLNLQPVWFSELSRLLPELAPGAPPPAPSVHPADESRLWEAVTRLLSSLSQLHPVVLFLDDIHWADTATLALLGYLARSLDDSQVALIGAAHPTGPRSPLAGLQQRLVREGRFTRIALSRLSVEETAELAQTLSPLASEALAGWLTRNAEGNPYILAELVRFAKEGNLLRPEATPDLADADQSPVVPNAVYTLIQARLARLSDTAHQLLDVAVIVGREFSFDLVAHAANLPEAAALDAIDELRQAGLVRTLDDGRFAFDHTLTREVAYREIGELRHRLLHRHVAEALEQISPHHDEIAGLIASHYLEGRQLERAVPYALQAGHHAAQLSAWHEAVAFYEQALAGATQEQRAEILLELGTAYSHAGEIARASEVFRDALALAEHTSDEAVEQARLGLATSLITQARFAEILELVPTLATSHNPRTRFDAEFLWGTALSLEGADLDGAIDHLQRAETIGMLLEDDMALAQVRFERGNIAAQQGNLEQAIGLYHEALEAAEHAGEAAVSWQILANNNLGYHLHLLGQPEALAYARAGMCLAQEQGMIGFQLYLLSTLGEISLASGDLAEAERSFQEGLALAERLQSPERIAGLTANLGRVAAQRGQTALAIHRYSTALARADALGTQHLAAQIRLWLAPLLPDEEARIYVAEARAIAERGGRSRILAEADEIQQTLAAHAHAPHDSAN